jgi:hypothetical protein
MEALYRVDIHEMQPVGSLPDQIALQLQHGRTMLVELDSFYLPDTSATDYRRNHVKSTVAIDAIDQLSETLIYFHNTGLFQLSSNDYRGIFRLDDPREDQLPPYLEIARFDLGPAPRGEELRATARECLRHHLRYRPRKNPFEAFAAQLARDLPILLQGDPESFHAYAFATVRMAGAAFDLLRAHVDWLLDGDSEEAFAPVVEGCQILSFRLARRRPFDPASTIDAMARAWASGMSGLELAIG